MKHLSFPYGCRFFIGAIALFALSSCASAGPPPSVTIECPDNALVSTVFLDVTGSSFSGQIDDEYEEVISQVATRTASCSGTMTVATFGESSGQTASLLRQSFQVEAPTENARKRKRQRLAEEAVDEVRSNLESAAARTPSSATDILGLLRLVEETKAQLPNAAHEVTILTDGLTNVGVNPATARDVAAAITLAEQVSVPDLSGIDLTFSGVGRSTSVVSSSVIEQATAFWKRVCQRTGADSCMVVTQRQGR